MKTELPTNQEVVRVYTKLKDITRTAHHFNVRWGFVREILRKEDALIRGAPIRRKFLSDEKKKEVADTYMTTSLTSYEVALMFKIKASSVLNYVRSFYGENWKDADGLKAIKSSNAGIPKTALNKQQTDSLIREAWNRYGSIQDVVEKTGLSKARVNSWLRETNSLRCLWCGKTIEGRLMRFCCSKHQELYARITKQYGLSKTAYEKIVKKQNGKCALCESETALHIDHNHITGKVRGLICVPCNTAIGKLGLDNIDVLQKLRKYLKRGV
jgi:hypothetical protein